MPTPPEHPPQRLANLLGALALTVTDAVVTALAQGGVAYGSDSFALVLLSQQTLRCDQLARQLALAPSSVARLVDRLERDRLLHRRTGEDRRTVWLVLTDQGRLQAQRILAARGQPLHALVQQLTPGEQNTLSQIAEKLLAALTPDAEQATRNCRLCDERACDLTRCPVERCWQHYSADPATLGATA